MSILKIPLLATDCDVKDNSELFFLFALIRVEALLLALFSVSRTAGHLHSSGTVSFLIIRDQMSQLQ